MQRSKLGRLAVALVCGGLMTGLGVSSVHAQPTAAKAAKAKQEKAAAAVQEVRLVHQLDPVRAQALQDLAARFNEGSKDVQIRVEEGSWAEKSGPHMMLLQGEELERFLGGTPRFKPLHAMMREAGTPLQSVRTPGMLARDAVDGEGRLLALPVGMSTPVLYINRSAFTNAGLDADAPVRTWFDLQQTLGRLAQAGSSCPYTVSEPAQVMIENTSAWHNEPVAARRGRIEAPSFNGMLQVKHIAMMASWHRARYLRIFDGEREAEQRFASGECAVIAAPSASWGDFRRSAGFPMGFQPLPFHDDFPGAPQNTLADGPALWVAAGKRPAEYKAVARFVKFWLEPENQIAWQRESGYLPLNRAGQIAAKAELRDPEQEIARVALGQLADKPSTPYSGASSAVARRRVRDIVNEELRAVWADVKPAKEALDTAVTRAQALVPLR